MVDDDRDDNSDVATVKDDNNIHGDTSQYTCACQEATSPACST